MFEQTKFVSNSFSLVFPRQLRIRRLANELEDRLAGRYFQPQIISVPDDLDPEIPRMIFGSEHGFSQIVVSQVNMSLNVTYSPDWQVEVSKGRSYLLERVPILFELLGILDGVEPLFCGLTTQANLPSLAEDEAIVRNVAEIFLKDEDLRTVHDVQIKTTTLLSERFFSNITVQNYRLWDAMLSQQGVTRFPRADAVERGLQILGDFNDRYAFNEDEDYVSSQEVAGEVIENGLAEVTEMVARVGGVSNDDRG